MAPGCLECLRQGEKMSHENIIAAISYALITPPSGIYTFRELKLNSHALAFCCQENKLQEARLAFYVRLINQMLESECLSAEREARK
jgi:hypothetical protein